MATCNIGSDGWRDSSRLDRDSELEESVQRCLTDTNWDKIITLCTELRNGSICTLSEKFSIGTENLVKLVTFEDGVKWVARVSLQDEDNRYKAGAADVMRNEVANYKYLRRYTSLPVPEVYHYDTKSSNEVGAPFMLLTYIHGTVADECGLNDNQYRVVLAQIAKMTVEIASHTFPTIGCLVEGSDGSLKIGKELETDREPFQTAREYYTAVCLNRFQVYAKRYFRNNEDAERCPGIQLPLLFNSFMHLLTTHNTDKGPFYLTNRDLGLHNVLVDANLQIVGVIDCDTMFAAPIHVAAQHMHIGIIHPPKPGHVTKKIAAKETYQRGSKMFEFYVECVKEAELKLYGKTTLADAMKSDGAKLVEGLESYRSMQEWVNAEWVKSYWYMYYRSLAGAGRCIEFSDFELPDIASEEDIEVTEGTEDAGNSKCHDDSEEPQTLIIMKPSLLLDTSRGVGVSITKSEHGFWRLSNIRYLVVGILMGIAFTINFYFVNEMTYI